jgi:hypothetical protein
MRVICLFHPGYDPAKSPHLTCKTCCSLFLAELRRKRLEERLQPLLDGADAAPTSVTY